MPSSLTWSQARALARTGTRIRREGWETEWLWFGTALWFMGEALETSRVVQTEDFGSAEFLANDWTTEPFTEPDPCQRPPRRPEFQPPSISLSAELVGTGLFIRPVLSAGSFGEYALHYVVNGVSLAVGTASTPGVHPKTVELSADALDASLDVEVWVYSVLPLLPWLGKAAVTVTIPPCELCGSGTLPAWLVAHDFPTTDSGVMPYSLAGSSVAGLTIYGDITSDGTSFGRTGGGNLGGSLRFDNSLIVFPVVARDFVIAYDYIISAGGKHWVHLMADGANIDSHFVMFGSWSNNFSNTQAMVGAGSNQSSSMCQLELEPVELTGLLPQTSGVWRTRTLSKVGDTLTVIDGATGPLPLTRCYFPTRGHVALNLGPGVRIKNLTISAT